jgi:hypothetical protein
MVVTAIHRGHNPLVEADVLSESLLLWIRTIRNMELGKPNNVWGTIGK